MERSIRQIIIDKSDHYTLTVDVTAKVRFGLPTELTFDVAALRVVPEIGWSCAQLLVQRITLPAGGGTKRLTFVFPFSPACDTKIDPAKHFYQVRIDETSKVSESNEGNNVLYLNTL